MTNGRNIVVKRLPETLHARSVRELRKELDPVLKSDRPSVVLDFARVRQMDGSGVELLVECLENAMKRDGDIKLAAIPQELSVILELTRVDRLFEIFDTTDDAIESFHTFTASKGDVSSPRVPGADGNRTNGKPNGHFKLVS